MKKLIVCILLGLFIAYLNTSALAEPCVEQKNAYQRLEKMLPVYEKAVKQPWPTLSVQYILKKGSNDPAVVLLRKRLAKTNDLVSCEAEKDDTFFDQNVEEAVRL